MKPEETTSEHITEHKQGGLTEFPATAICGNDITSSCLYVSALTIIAAGRSAPLALLIVAAVLFLFRPIYSEVVGALPLNGGAYNALLNTTSKFRASIAACLTILSYTATAVISANQAMHYSSLFQDGSQVILATIGLLAIFTVLTIIGITESSKVAMAIFVTHLTSLTVLLVVGIAYVATQTGLGTLMENMATPEPGGFTKAIFFGFAAALLGISGFESSANFVEEQAEGVFPKTLRNMWVAVAIFNPAIAVLALALIAIPDVGAHKAGFLAHLGAESGGEWLRWVISLDAVLVLSGAVLTSFVGVNGLVRRMTLDRCLPQFLLKTNRRGTTHRIVIAFFLLSVSVLLVTEGKVEALAGVYTLSFLSVMVLFCLGNILLKVKRATLPRPIRAAWPTVLTAMLAVTIGLIGNAIKEPEPGQPRNVAVFLEYFVPALLIVSIMLTRIALLKMCLFIVRALISALIQPMHGITQWIRTKIDTINSQQVVFFTRGDNISNLNNALLYVRQNEHTNRLKVVTVVRNRDDVPARLKTDLEFLDEAYPEIDIEFVVLQGTFGPELIRELSEKWRIPANLMFIGSPRGHLMYGLAELGGVRLII